MAGTIEMTRANRIAVQATEAGFKADFYRTHKKLATMWSEESGWEADESMNRSALREDFRRFAIDHASAVGILWNPDDLRADGNRRIAKYETDEILKQDAVDLMWNDLWNLTNECGLGVEFGVLMADIITPMTTTAKGTDLSKMGVVDGKYEKSGNWAWAEIEMTLTLTKEGQEIYYMTTCQLVSGQLKKPHITKTGFTESIKESLKELGLLEEESKAEDAKVEDAESAEEIKEEDTTTKEESKPKRSRSKKSKKAEESAE